MLYEISEVHKIVSTYIEVNNRTSVCVYVCTCVGPSIGKCCVANSRVV